MAKLKVLPGGGVPRNAKQALGIAQQEHLDCRDLRHPWRIVGMFYTQGKHGKEIHRKLVCTRCGTEATDKWSPRGERLARQYKYVEGYQTHVGVRIKPVDVRREVMNRVPVYGSEEEMMTNLFRGSRRKRA